MNEPISPTSRDFPVRLAMYLDTMPQYLGVIDKQKIMDIAKFIGDVDDVVYEATQLELKIGAQPGVSRIDRLWNHLKVKNSVKNTLGDRDEFISREASDNKSVDGE